MPNGPVLKSIDHLGRTVTVAPRKGIRISESGKILFAESGIQLKESEIPLTIGIQNRESQIPVPPTAKTGINYLDYGINSVESRVQDCLRSDSYPVASLYAL